jgi:uncharacterized membrane protein
VADDSSRLYRLATSLEGVDRLDTPAAAVERLAARLLPGGSVRANLHGRWLGHALHPMLTDFPLGTWMSTSLLDLIGGRRSRTASRRLLTFGVVAAVPTVVTGLADYLSADDRQRRVAVVHAAVNTTALALYTASLIARRRDRHGAGVAFGLAGGVTATVGGFFGGHLSLARDAGRRASEAARDGSHSLPSG